MRAVSVAIQFQIIDKNVVYTLIARLGPLTPSNACIARLELFRFDVL